MKQLLNVLAWALQGSMVIALAVTVPACEKGDKGEEEGSETTGSIQAALMASGDRHDVTAVHYKVVDASGTCSDAAIAESTSALEAEDLPGSVLPPGAGAHAGADSLFVLPPGNYRICATPLSDNGPSQVCAAAEGTASVFPEATTEILLVSQCSADANGGVDVIVALNDPPQINDLDITPSKFILACETATITVSAEDLDGDQLNYSWSIQQSPAGSAPQLQAMDATATFVTDMAGDYQVQVVVSDVNAASTSLSFPIHVSACAAQDQCHTAGACDLGTGACSNPTSPDGTACDDGDPNSSPDVCMSGVCAGIFGGCACPAGFTPFVDGCAKSYDIDASLLVNLDVICDIAGIDRYNGCNGAYGFQWTDSGVELASVTQVDVALEAGTTCGGTSLTPELNGAPIGSFTSTGICNCPSSHDLASFSNVDISTYVHGGVNSISIFTQSCEGLSQSAALNGAYARVTVRYSCDPSICAGVTCTAQDECHSAGMCDLATGFCSNPVAPDGTTCTNGDPNNPVSVCLNGVCAECGDGTCDVNESCQSCVADCGVCPPCPLTDLGTDVPQTVIGSTVGLSGTQQGTCAPTAGPDMTFGFTAPVDGAYQIDTFGSVYDTVLYVQDAVCGGAELVCNDDTQGLESQVSVFLTAGQTVVIVVDGFGGNAGDFTLNINLL